MFLSQLYQVVSFSEGFSCCSVRPHLSLSKPCQKSFREISNFHHQDASVGRQPIRSGCTYQGTPATAQKVKKDCRVISKKRRKKHLSFTCLYIAWLIAREKLEFDTFIPWTFLSQNPKIRDLQLEFQKFWKRCFNRAFLISWYRLKFHGLKGRQGMTGSRSSQQLRDEGQKPWSQQPNAHLRYETTIQTIHIPIVA